MSDVDRLEAEFEAGRLLRPSANDPNIVDLANALASVAGAGASRLTPGAEALARLIGTPDHLVFIAADGLGMALVESLDAGAFLREHMAETLHTVFPSTTASAFASLATGEWPNRHAALGWYTYIPEIDTVTTIVPFVRSIDEVPLTSLGLNAKQAFPLPSLMARRARDGVSLIPQPFVDSVFSIYVSGGTPRTGYGALPEAMDAIAARVQAASEPTYTYLYVPYVDHAGHEFGYSDPRTLAAATALDQALQGLVERLSGRARVVLTADHGGLDSAIDRRHMLRASDPLVQLLKHAPSGDSRVVYFDVREGDEGEFQQVFRARFGDRFFLITVEEAEALELFGPGPLSDETRRRLGTFVAVSAGPDVLLYDWPSHDHNKPPHVGHHSGLSPAEVRIPLVVA